MSWNFQIHYSYLLNNIICRKKDNCDIYILLNHCASHIFWYIVFGWIYLWNQCLSPLKFRVRTPLIERCIHCIYDWSYLTIGCYSIQQYVIVCQWHATGCWFFPGTNKTDRYDLVSVCVFAKRLLKVVADDTGCFLIYKAKGIVPHYFHQMTGKSRQHIGHLLHQGRGRLEC